MLMFFIILILSLNKLFVCLFYLVLMYIIIMIFLQNSTGKITQKQYYFLLNILSRYVLFDGLFYDSFLFHCLLCYPLFYEIVC